MYKTMKNSFFLMSIGLISIFSSCKRVYFDTPPLGTCSDQSIANLISNDHFVFDKNGGTQIGTGNYWWISYEIDINGVECFVLPDSTTSYSSTNSGTTRITGALYTSNDTLMRIPIHDSHVIMRPNGEGFTIDTIANSWFCISTNYYSPASLTITLEKNTTTECRYINMQVWAGNCRRFISIEQEAGE